MSETEPVTNPTGGVDVTQWLERVNRAAGRQRFQVHDLGSCHGWPLLALTRSLTNAPQIYLSTGVHGDEPAGPLAVLHWLEHGHLDPAINWRICPLLNPAGLAAGTRATACGRDLNRDYAHFETAEATLHADWLRHQPPPQVMLSLHEDYETQGVYVYEINTSGAVSHANDLLAAAAEILPVEPAEEIDGHRVDAPGWILHPPEPDEPGWPEAIFVASLGPGVSYTVETPSRAALPKRIEALTAMMRQLVTSVLDDADSISGSI